MKRNQGFHLCFVSVEILEMRSQPFMLYLHRSNEIGQRWRRSVQPSSGQETQKHFFWNTGPVGAGSAKEQQGNTFVWENWLIALLLPNWITCLLIRSPEQMSEQGGERNSLILQEVSKLAQQKLKGIREPLYEYVQARASLCPPLGPVEFVFRSNYSKPAPSMDSSGITLSSALGSCGLTACIAPRA